MALTTNYTITSLTIPHHTFITFAHHFKYKLQVNICCSSGHIEVEEKEREKEYKKKKKKKRKKREKSTKKRHMLISIIRS